MKEKIVAVSMLISLMLVPLSVTGTEKTKSKHPEKGKVAPAAGTPSASPTPPWDITKPSSCSVEGPPPCEKCSITCPAGHPPICIPGDVANGVCVKPNSCTCKEEQPGQKNPAQPQPGTQPQQGAQPHPGTQPKPGQ